MRMGEKGLSTFRQKLSVCKVLRDKGVSFQKHLDIVR